MPQEDLQTISCLRSAFLWGVRGEKYYLKLTNQLTTLKELSLKKAERYGFCHTFGTPAVFGICGIVIPQVLERFCEAGLDMTVPRNYWLLPVVAVELISHCPASRSGLRKYGYSYAKRRQLTTYATGLCAVLLCAGSIALKNKLPNWTEIHMSTRHTAVYENSVMNIAHFHQRRNNYDYLVTPKLDIENRSETSKNGPSLRGATASAGATWQSRAFKRFA